MGQMSFAIAEESLREYKPIMRPASPFDGLKQHWKRSRMKRWRNAKKEQIS
jgi:hypothetical protein